MSIKHVMVDLETWGKKGFIVSIGAAEFDPWGTGVKETFHQAIHPASVERCGFRPDAETLLWWMASYNAAGREAWLSLPKVDLDEALIGFQTWCEQKLAVKPAELVIWGNGATFDNVILKNAFDALQFETPWGFKGDGCFRTLKRMAPGIERPEGLGLAHDALADAVTQAHWMQKIVAHLELKVL